MAYMEVTVVRVEEHETWDCSMGLCRGQVVAYLAVHDSEETYGYCEAHLGDAVLAEMDQR